MHMRVRAHTCLMADVLKREVCSWNKGRGREWWVGGGGCGGSSAAGRGKEAAEAGSLPRGDPLIWMFTRSLIFTEAALPLCPRLH